ncbi:MAG: threonine/serine dehydratase [bacterium]|nr:threonine/serine dehydratase [bacterium]
MDLSDRPTGWGGSPVPRPSLEAIRAARERILGKVVRTPLVPLHSDRATTDIFLKPETLQPIGSFKLRGVLNWATRLTEADRKKGLSTTSAGNTAQALGYVARLFDIPSRTLLPDTVPQNKLDAILSYGVEPVQVPFDQLLNYMLQEHWREEPYSYLNPWGDPDMIAGSGTIGLEIVDDLPDVDTVFAPVGGGGLIAGVGSALKALNPSIRVIGVQPESCPTLHKAFEADRGLWIQAGTTICDGTAVPVIVDEMYPLLREVVDDVALVSEEAVKDAIRLVALKNKLIVEGSGALSVAAALATPDDRKSVCILSGGSIDTERLMEILG